MRLLRRDDEGSDVLGEVVDLSAAVHIRLYLKDACVDGLGAGLLAGIGGNRARATTPFRYSTASGTQLPPWRARVQATARC